MDNKTREFVLREAEQNAGLVWNRAWEAEYIEREAAINVVKHYERIAIDEKQMLLDIVARIEKLPAADVAPVRRGHWKSKVNPQWRAHSHDECSVCGWWNTRNAMCYDGNHKPGHSLNYCPNCGAKMME